MLLAQERLLEQVMLIDAIGEPQRNRLCLLSLAAHLAGEPHGDRPESVSPVLRAFLVPINDAMDNVTRQWLKPFAPRLITWRHEREAALARLVYEGVLTEVAPRLLRAVMADGSPREAAEAAAWLGHWPEAVILPARRLERELTLPEWALPTGMTALRRLITERRSRDPQRTAAAAGRLVAETAQRLSGLRTRRELWWGVLTLLDGLMEGQERSSGSFRLEAGDAAQ